MLTTEKPEELTQQRRSIKMESKEFLLGANVALWLVERTLTNLFEFEKDEKNLERVKSTFNAVKELAFEKSLTDALEENKEEFEEVLEKAMEQMIEGFVSDILKPLVKKVVKDIPEEVN